MTIATDLYLFYGLPCCTITSMRSLRITQTLRSLIAGPRDSSDDVHFHQGPQAQATPCFDEHCQRPRLSV